MILTVTLNAAIDVTYRVERFHPGTTMRVADVHERAGGKGVNVARVLAALGAPVCATGLAGGHRGDAIRSELAGLGIRADFETITGESRQTLVATDGRGHPTEFDEPGPAVAAAEWDRFQRRFSRLAADARVVVLAGSLPPGVPAEAYAQLTTAARHAGAAVIVDAGGPVLRLACGAGPDIVTPNDRELGRAAGGAAGDSAAGDGAANSAAGDGAAGDGAGGDGAGGAALRGVDGDGGAAGDGSGARVAAALDAGQRLRGLGAGAVVASLGTEGAVAVTSGGCWRVTHQRVDGNPIGAGDALTAGLAAGCLSSSGWPEMLASAAGLAMASVTRPWAGDVDAAEAAELGASVRVRGLRAVPPT